MIGRSLTALALSLSLIRVGSLCAQNPMDRIGVRTFPLQSLSPKDAADLVAPYTMFVPGAGVYEAGGALRAITVRGTSEMLARVDSILRANDHPRATLVMRFQLIAASETAARDPAISDVDTELRSLFRFAGYRLLSQGTAVVNEAEMFSLLMGGANGDVLRLSGSVFATRPAGKQPLYVVDGVVSSPASKGTAQIAISLTRMIATTNGTGVRMPTLETLLTTGLTVPLGQTVVIGSAAYGASIPAIILVVRPEVATKP
jgi:hypothetical protein